jgi:hypothetical protein
VLQPWLLNITREAKQVLEFLEGLEDGQVCKFYHPIKRNNIDFFRQKPETSSKDLKLKNIEIIVSCFQNCLFHASHESAI